MRKFDNLVLGVKKLGDLLVPYNFPQNDPALEDDLNAVKVTHTVVDGYDVTIYYSKADHNDFILETVQVYADNHPFLPFALVVKIARKFLGSEKLSLIEFMRMDRKVYCWTVYRNLSGKPINPPYESMKHLAYEGFEYTYLSPSNVNFY